MCFGIDMIGVESLEDCYYSIKREKAVNFQRKANQKSKEALNQVKYKDVNIVNQFFLKRRYNKNVQRRKKKYNNKYKDLPISIPYIGS